MILIVATICVASTGAKAGRVATVTDSSIRLRRFSRSRSTTQSPRVAANRLTLPVKAALTVSPEPATALAILDAAASSPTSPSSRRAAVTCPIPAAFRAAASSALRVRPFLKAAPFRRTECTRMAPTASSGGMGPKRIGSGRHRFFRPVPVQDVGDLGHDRQRDLRRRNSPDRKPYRCVDTADLGLGKAFLTQPVHPLAMGLSAAQRPDIER